MASFYSVINRFSNAFVMQKRGRILELSRGESFFSQNMLFCMGIKIAVEHCSDGIEMEYW